MNIQKFQRLPNISGEDAEDTSLLLEMAKTTEQYVTSFSWCPPIEAMYLADGVGGIVAISFVQFPRKIKGSDDEKLWIVVGDLPSAYVVVEPHDSPGEALERYCRLMEDWIRAVRRGGDLKEVYPVEAKPTLEHADMLEGRLGVLRAEIIPGTVQTGQ